MVPRRILIVLWFGSSMMLGFFKVVTGLIWVIDMSRIERILSIP